MYLISFHFQVAERLMYTCSMMYFSTPTGLAPEITHFTPDSLKPQTTPTPPSTTPHPSPPLFQNFQAMRDQLGILVKPLDAHSILRPETVESLFYLHRVTGNQTYANWGWEIFLAFEKHCMGPKGGFVGLKDVLDPTSAQIDLMESFFLAETLKYLYLLFSDDRSLLSFDEFVLNTEAHPLPIIEPPVLDPTTTDASRFFQKQPEKKKDQVSE